jgi:hypothetical protein
MKPRAKRNRSAVGAESGSPRQHKCQPAFTGLTTATGNAGQNMKSPCRIPSSSICAVEDAATAKHVHF